MRLKEKTYKKFADFFEKMALINKGQEFEIAFSEIQRETGTASVTMKRAIKSLQDDSLIEVNPGRNSRYATFKYLKELPIENNEKEGKQSISFESSSSNSLPKWNVEMYDLHHLVENLRRRVRSQEMTIALLQDRIAEIEDKLYKH